MAVADDWVKFLKEQIAGAEKWAQENPMAAGFVVIVLASVAIIGANKAYDIWLKS
jgi:hypothetical protein